MMKSTMESTLKCDNIHSSQPMTREEYEEWRSQFSYRVPKRKQVKKNKKCIECGCFFVAKRSHAWTCSPRCRQRNSRKNRH